MRQGIIPEVEESMTLPIRETIEIANCLATHMSPGQAKVVIAHLRTCSLLDALSIGLTHGNKVLQESCAEDLRLVLEMPGAEWSDLIAAVEKRMGRG